MVDERLFQNRELVCAYVPHVVECSEPRFEYRAVSNTVTVRARLYERASLPILD